MRIDLHNHTSLCNHATGTPYEYLQRAITLGIDVYGFSDHAPMRYDPQYRMRMDQRQAYRSMIMEAQHLCQRQIETLFGYEVDYIEGYVEEAILNESCDYLIGSVHFIDEWGFDNPEFLKSYETKDPDTTWKRYFQLMTDMVQTGHFQIVGHFDLLKVFNFLPSRNITSLADECLHAIKDHGMAIEINTAGLRKPVQELYPSFSLLSKAFELQIPITFGSDAHSVEQVGFGYEQARELAYKVGYRQCALFREKKLQLVNF